MPLSTALKLLLKKSATKKTKRFLSHPDETAADSSRHAIFRIEEFMTSYPRSPRLIKGGIVLVDPTSGAIRRVIALQYNPDTLTRTLAVQAAGGEGGDRLEAMRLKGPPTETIKLDAEIDTTDQLEFPEKNRD